jgi:hypothetical protein
MKRYFRILVSLSAIALLAHPFDCFASARAREAMDCCLKEKCAPTVKAGCCKDTAPGANQFIGSNAAGHLLPVPALAPGSIPMLVPAFSIQGWDDLLRHPPPLTALSGRTLPLLI